MHVYPCDMILDVCDKHPFVATFWGGGQGLTKTDKEEKKEKKHACKLKKK